MLQQIIDAFLALFKGPTSHDDVTATLDKRAVEAKEQLNWRKSIVDLLKVLNMDSSLQARVQLARDLGYKGPFDGSAEMNSHLHELVMAKLADHGIPLK